MEGIVRVIDSPPEISQAENPDASCSNSAPYKVYNIGNSSPVQLMEYIAAIEKQLGKTAQKEFLPGEFSLTGLPMQPGDVPRTDADITDLMANLGYKPDTPVEKGIERFVAWYKEYFKR